MTNAALIVAAGRGQRMERDLPKQYLTLGDGVVLSQTIRAMLASPLVGLVRVVIHPDDRSLYNAAVAGLSDMRLLEPVTGGTSRSDSVRLGLHSLSEYSPDTVLIHDAARPFCSVDLIARVLSELANADGAFAALPIVDAVWKTTNGCASGTVDRTDLWRAQTPQGFRFAAILGAHDAATTDAADDVEIAHLAGLTIKTVQGDERNFKITLPQDLDRAARLIPE